METIELEVGGYPISVEYEYSQESDPYGTGDSPTMHYVELLSIKLIDSDIEVIDLFDSFFETIEEKIIEFHN